MPRLPDAGISKDMDNKSLFLGSILLSRRRILAPKGGRERKATSRGGYRLEEKREESLLRDRLRCNLCSPTSHYTFLSTLSLLLQIKEREKIGKEEVVSNLTRPQTRRALTSEEEEEPQDWNKVLFAVPLSSPPLCSLSAKEEKEERKSFPPLSGRKSAANGCDGTDEPVSPSILPFAPLPSRRFAKLS